MLVKLQVSVILMLSFLIAVLSAPALAGAQTKGHTVQVAPAAIAADAKNITFTAAYKNVSSHVDLGSANLTFPAGFAVRLPALSGNVSGAATAAVKGSTVEMRNLAVPAGKSFILSVQLDALGCPPNGTLESLAKQANNFNAVQGNDIPLVGPKPRTSVVCGLRFSTHPESARVNEVLTGTAYDAAGPPVAVELVDATNQRVTSASGAVTVELTDRSDLLAGTTTVGVVNGVATFDDLTVSEIGRKFELKATSESFSATSDEFEVQQDAKRCVNGDGNTCQASATVHGSSGGVSTSSANSAQSLDYAHTITVTAHDDPAVDDAGLLTVSWEMPAETIDCTVADGVDYPEVIAETAVFDMPERKLTVEVDIEDDNPLFLLSERPTACWASDSPFTTLFGTPAKETDVGNNGSLEYLGLLRSCEDDQDEGPCVVPGLSAFGPEFVMRAPIGDPYTKP